MSAPGSLRRRSSPNFASSPDSGAPVGLAQAQHGTTSAASRCMTSADQIVGQGLPQVVALALLGEQLSLVEAVLTASACALRPAAVPVPDIPPPP